MAAQVPLIWITAVVVLALLIIAAGAFVKIYQSKRDRDAFVTTVCILSLTCLLATVCLFPVDIALVSSTTSSHGFKKPWATPETVHHILLSLKIVYYLLYSLDAVLCLIVIPFAYFWYEEWDVGTTVKQRLKGALKYSIFFLALFILLLVVGLFVPAAREMKRRQPLDLEYFKRLLLENHGERSLTFIVGILMCLGTILFVIYTAPGLAVTPMVLIKSIPTASVPGLAQATSEALAINRERQRAIEAKYTNSTAHLNSRDRRELESLQREERTLVRRRRIAEESVSSRSKRIWLKLCAIGRPFKIAGGIITLLITILLIVSMLITGIDKLRNSRCGRHCGFILPYTYILNPINSLFVAASRAFPVDYILALALVLLFFIASVIGIAFIGIRFLWVSIFKLRVGGTKPQGLLLTTVMLTLITLAVNYSFTMLLFPSYAHFGGQKYCNLLPCTATSPLAICTPTVVSSFINRITLNFPFLGVIMFYAQFVAMGVYAVVLITGIVWTPRLAGRGDEEEEEEEEEGLLASAGRGGRVAWEDLSGDWGELHQKLGIFDRRVPGPGALRTRC
ncbi:hypothetical protein EX30DRAFT_358620 [Ascodesmis nigricans]|uniref:Probable lysosomal cobalamin transporter n=1 Tax=Ascodesmis nigricans TaxID=341454 RepID=A0A4S2MYP5_9PEZI|nr:hypothetical protein EX30DRAFT_358620 [Ascodesmis nigricans]